MPPTPMAFVGTGCKPVPTNGCEVLALQMSEYGGISGICAHRVGYDGAGASSSNSKRNSSMTGLASNSRHI
jgi:hypothetical protein